VVVTGSPVVGSVVISGATGLVLIPKGSVVWNSCVGTVGAGAAFGWGGRGTLLVGMAFTRICPSLSEVAAS
jgi:hypothetical protein